MSFASKPAEPNKSQSEDKNRKLEIGISVVKHQIYSHCSTFSCKIKTKILWNVRAGKGRRDMQEVGLLFHPQRHN